MRRIEMKAYVYAGLVAAGLTTGGYAMAHHSFAAEFDANNKVELSGIYCAK